MTPRKPKRAADLKVTDDEYEGMLAEQGGVCAICGNPPKVKRLHVDHDHATGVIRGLLCHRCNRALATWVSPAWLLLAAVYLDGNDSMTIMLQQYIRDFVDAQ